MNENEDFESLRRLLALKRHEVPPPGYFNRFSDHVIGRIRAGENAPADAAENLFSRVPWLLKFLQIFESKPAFASSFASALCLLLLFGIVYAEQSDQVPQPILNTSEMSPEMLTASATPMTVAQAPAQGIFEGISNSSPSSLQPMFNSSFVRQVNLSFPGN